MTFREFEQIFPEVDRDTLYVVEVPFILSSRAQCGVGGEEGS